MQSKEEYERKRNERLARLLARGANTKQRREPCLRDSVALQQSNSFSLPHGHPSSNDLNNTRIFENRVEKLIQRFLPTSKYPRLQVVIESLQVLPVRVTSYYSIVLFAPLFDRPSTSQYFPFTWFRLFTRFHPI